MESTPHTTGQGGPIIPLLSLLLIVTLCISPVLGDDIYITMQDLGVIQDQDIKIFNDTGGLVVTINTSMGVSLNTTESTFYTFQIQPAVTNMNGTTMLEDGANFVANNALGVILVLVIVALIFGRKR